MTRLRGLGYPVEAVAGPGGGYRLGAGGKLPPLLLDDEEALAVALGLRVATATAVGGLEEASLSALSKLENVLPPRLRTRLEDISVATVSTVSSSASRADHSALALAASAARSRQRLRFGYIDGEGRTSERHAEPLRLVHTGRRWYLVAFDLDREDWRTFRLDRVSSPKVTGMRSTRRPEPDPVELVERGVAVDVYTHRGTVRLQTTVERARQVIPTTVGALEALDGGDCRLIIGADDITWLARYLLGLPWEFVVEGPDELVEELGRIGADLVAAYSSTSSSTSASSSSVAVPVSETIRSASVGK